MTTITTYRQQTRRLLSDFSVEQFIRQDLDFYINSARKQVATEGECIRDFCTLSTTISVSSYPFSAITVPSGVGYQSAIDVRLAYITLSSFTPLIARPWEWFFNYLLPKAGVTLGNPAQWAVQGTATGAKFWVSPTPNGTVVITLDSVILPAALAIDADIEALPYPFTDAVPFYAAYLALNSAQQADGAATMFQQFEVFMRRAVQGSTPSALPGNYPGGAGAEIVSRKVPLSGSGSTGQ